MSLGILSGAAITTTASLVGAGRIVMIAAISKTAVPIIAT
jgi:hypothetical protein